MYINEFLNHICEAAKQNQDEEYLISRKNLEKAIESNNLLELNSTLENFEKLIEANNTKEIETIILRHVSDQKEFLIGLESMIYFIDFYFKFFECI